MILFSSHFFVTSCNLDQIHGDFVLRDNQTQVLNPLLVELALLQAEEEFVLLQDLQHPSDRLRVLFLCLGEDQDVVQIDHHNTFHYEVLEDVVHHGLEGGQTVSHSKEYHQGFE